MSQPISCPWPEWTIDGPGIRIGRQTLCRLHGSQPAMLQALDLPGGVAEASRICEWIRELHTETMGREQEEPLSGESSGVHLVRYDSSHLTEGPGFRLSLRMEPLDSITRRYDRLSYPHTEEIVRLGKHICIALEQFRQHDLIHERVTPWGIFYDNSSDVYKLGAGWDDAFLAPELVSEKKADHTADVYSLGLVLYWLLNERRLPFLPPLPAQVTPGMERESFQRRCGGEILPPPRHGSRELKSVILTACAFRPRDRYQTAGQLLEALQKVPLEERSAPDSGRAQDAPEGSRVPPLTRLKPVLAVAAAALLLVGARSFVHLWRSADCTQGEVCRICGKTRGEALDHAWAQAPCGEFPVCSRCGEVRPLAQEHVWNTDACDAARTCTACGFTEPEPRGHDWLPATCMDSSRCSRCGLTQGGIGDHAWQEATRDAPRTCMACGLTEGTAQTKHLIYAEYRAPGYPGHTFEYTEDGPIMISVEDCVEFAGSEVTLTDSTGTPVDEAHFEVSWTEGLLSLTPLESLEPGIYTASFGDTGVRTTLVYGYLREIYHHSTDTDDGYFLLSQNWKNGRYLTFAALEEQSILVTEESRTNPASFSIKQLMAADPESYESRLYWYCPDGWPRVKLRTYYADGRYLASDENGTVYLSEELTEECYWIVEHILI